MSSTRTKLRWNADILYFSSWTLPVFTVVTFIVRDCLVSYGMKTRQAERLECSLSHLLLKISKPAKHGNLSKSTWNHSFSRRNGHDGIVFITDLLCFCSSLCILVVVGFNTVLKFQSLHHTSHNFFWKRSWNGSAIAYVLYNHNTMYSATSSFPDSRSHLSLLLLILIFGIIHFVAPNKIFYFYFYFWIGENCWEYDINLLESC